MKKFLYLVFIAILFMQCTEDYIDDIKNTDKRLIETVWHTNNTNENIEGDVVFHFNSINSGVVNTAINTNDEMKFKYFISHPELVITYNIGKTAHFRFKNDNTLVIIENNKEGDFILYKVTE